MFESFVKTGISKDGFQQKGVYNGEPKFSIKTGKVNDIIVLDLGFTSVCWFERNFFKLDGTSETLVISTPNKGYHVYFKYTYLVKSRFKCRGLDLDIHSDGRNVYAGDGYNVVSNSSKIREMSWKEVNKLVLDVGTNLAIAVPLDEFIDADYIKEMMFDIDIQREKYEPQRRIYRVPCDLDDPEL